MRGALAVFGWVLSAGVAVAEVLPCPDSLITVEAETPVLAGRVCEVAARGIDLLESCNAPITLPLRINVVRDIGMPCVGVYHCGKQLIEVLHPETLATVPDVNEAFEQLSIETYFESIIVHEMTHAAYDVVPCPFGDCMATSEYLAYGMQVMSLAPEERATFVEQSGLTREIGRDEINPIFLMMAPGRFAQKAWLHLTQRPDACEFVGQIMSGAVLLDNERP